MLSRSNASVMIIGPQARPEPLRLKAGASPDRTRAIGSFANLVAPLVFVLFVGNKAFFRGYHLVSCPACQAQFWT